MRQRVLTSFWNAFIKKGVSTLIVVLAVHGCWQASAVLADDSPTTLPELENLQTLSINARQTNLPILLVFGAEWCEFCDILREKVLNPMVLGGRYEGQYVYLRYVSIDEEEPIPDWTGQPILKRDFAYKMNADLTPTVVFLGPDGREVAPRIIGIASLDLYAALIHKALNIAYQELGNPLQIPAMPDKMDAS